jgi:hypothetical protein
MAEYRAAQQAELERMDGLRRLRLARDAELAAKRQRRDAKAVSFKGHRKWQACRSAESGQRARCVGDYSLSGVKPLRAAAFNGSVMDAPLGLPR